MGVRPSDLLPHLGPLPPLLTGSRDEYLRVVGIHNDGWIERDISLVCFPFQNNSRADFAGGPTPPTGRDHLRADFACGPSSLVFISAPRMADEDRKLGAKRIDACGKKGVPQVSRIFGTSDQKSIPPTIFLRPIHNFYSLTVCRLDKYLQNGSNINIFLSFIGSSAEMYYQFPFAVTAARSKNGKPVCSV